MTPKTSTWRTCTAPTIDSVAEGGRGSAKVAAEEEVDMMNFCRGGGAGEWETDGWSQTDKTPAY